MFHYYNWADIVRIKVKHNKFNNPPNSLRFVYFCVVVHFPFVLYVNIYDNLHLHTIDMYIQVR